LRRQHAHADLFDDVSDAVDVVFLAHAKHKYIHKDPVPDRSTHVPMRLTAERSLALRPRSLSGGRGVLRSEFHHRPMQVRGLARMGDREQGNARR
jgi:hypothetical protein